MSKVGVYPVGGTAGTQVSSTYEGRHVTLREDELHHPAHDDGFVNKGDPVVVMKAGAALPQADGVMVGVAFIDGISTATEIPIDTEGIWDLTVYAEDQDGDSEVKAGDEIYIDIVNTGAISEGVGACGLSKIQSLETRPFGVALGGISQGSSDVISVKVHFDPLNLGYDEDVLIWVSKNGSDDFGNGSFLFPYLTITKAFTMIDGTKYKVMLMPGEYEEATTLTFPAYNCSLCGIGADNWAHGPVITEPTDGATTMKINHTVDGSRIIGIENLSIECNEEVTGTYALHIVKTGTAKLYLTLRNVTIEQDTDYIGVYVDFSGTSDKGNIWWTLGEIGGQIHCVWGHADDRLWLKYITNLDGIYTTGAYAGRILAQFCTLKPVYAVVQVAQNYTYLGCCVGLDGNEVYQVLTAIAAGTSAGIIPDGTI